MGLELGPIVRELLQPTGSLSTMTNAHAASRNPACAAFGSAGCRGQVVQLSTRGALMLEISAGSGRAILD